MEDAKPARRIRLRYSLRFALILLTGFACLLAFLVWYSKIRSDALAAVIQSGGYVDFIETGLPDWLLDRIGREYFVNIETVDAYYRKLTDDHLAAISKLPELRHVHTNHIFMGSTKGSFSISSNGNTGENELITDLGLEYISRSRRLESLVLFNTSVTDKGIEKLSNLKSIQYLKISSYQITDASVPQISKLQSLQRFWTSGTSITKEGSEQLRKALPNCEIITATGDESPFYDL